MEVVMRAVSLVLLNLVAVGVALAQEGSAGKRYGVELQADRYPQKTPQEALQSVLKAIDNQRVFYLLAHLADPAFVDERVRDIKKQAGLKGPEAAQDLVAFDQLVKEVSAHFREDPSLIRELRRLAKEGEWQAGDDKASARLKSNPNRRAFFRKLDDRWFLENKQE
jgi:hypothetical protein